MTDGSNPYAQYSYDSARNLTYEYDSSGQTLQKTYSYTPAGLLESVVHAGIGTSSMTWDADGNRVSFTSSSTSGVTEFVYDVTAGIPAVIEETGPVYYVREPNGSLIARVDGETVNYYHFDALGSTRLLTNASGAVTDEYTYDAWGNLTDHTQYDGSVSQPYQYVGQLGYYTHVQDTNFPLLQLGVRMYDPEIGRFGQVDPVREGGSWYVYCADRPSAAVDPSGLNLRDWYCHKKFTACMAARKSSAWLSYQACRMACYLAWGPPSDKPFPQPPTEIPGAEIRNAFVYDQFEQSCEDYADRTRKQADWLRENCGKKGKTKLEECYKDCQSEYNRRMGDALNDCLNAYCKCTSKYPHY